MTLPERREPPPDPTLTAARSVVAGAPGVDPRVGTVIDKYKVVRVLGRGGMGVVYEALNTRLDRAVALKVLPDALLEDPQASARFLQEAKAAARLNHPNAVAVYDADHRDGVHFIAMELVRGVSAQERIGKGAPMPWPEATRIVEAVCRALGAAHAAGLVHRDIKPANILLGADGAIKLADFGLAKAVGRGNTLTGPNAVIGTPQYMSPEQCLSAALDGRSDLYSLGAAYFALLTGRPPYDSETHLQTMYRHCHEPPPDPRAAVPGLPEGCAAIIRRAMAKSPADRYPEASSMAAELAGLAGGPATAVGSTPTAAATPTATFVAGGGATRPWTDAPTARMRAGVSPVLVGAALGAVLIGVAGYALYRAVRTPDNDGPALPSRPFLDDPRYLTKGGKDKDGSHKDSAAKDGATKAEPPPVGQQPLTGQFPGGRLPAAVQHGFLERASFKAHDGAIGHIAFNRNGSRLATASDDGLIRIWDPVTAAALKTLRGHAARAVTVAFAPDGDTLISGGSDGTVRLWSAASGRELRPPIRMDTDLVACIAVSPDGSHFVAVGGRDGKADPEMKLFSLPGAQEVRRFPYSARGSETDKGHTNMILCAAYSADGSRLLTCSSDDSVRLWEPADGRLLRTSWKHPQVDTVAFVPDGKRLVSGGCDGAVRVWDLATFSPRKQIGSACPPYVRTMSFTPDGRLLARGGDGVVLLFDMAGEKPIGELTGHRGRVAAAVFSNDGRTLASGDSAGTLKLWDGPEKP
jgi:WD40 repeat protein